MRSSYLIWLCVFLTGCSTQSAQAPVPANLSGADARAVRTLHREGQVGYGIVYAFQGLGGTDGISPQAGVSDVSGTLYGTTYSGTLVKNTGCTGGCGTVYAVDSGGRGSLDTISRSLCDDRTSYAAILRGKLKYTSSGVQPSSDEWGRSLL